MSDPNHTARTSPLRIRTWWQYIVPPVFAFAYLGILQQTLEPEAMWEAYRIWEAEAGPPFYCFSPPQYQLNIFQLVAFALSVIGTAGFGYFLNDLTDIRQDLAAGKPNQVAQWSRSKRANVGIGLVLLGIGSWMFWAAPPMIDWLVLALLGLEFLVFVLYSVPPIRLKERRFAGIVCDALYGHVLPVAIALTAFSPTREAALTNMAFALPVMALLGLRNILIHQIEDRHDDRKAGVKTFVQQFGPLRSLMLINWLLPFELGGLVLLLSALTGWGWVLPVIFGAFLCFQFLLFNFINWPYSLRRSGEQKFLFIYFLNDFYEEWLPVAVLGLLVATDLHFAWFLGAHLVLFPGFLLNFIRDLRTIRAFFIS